MSELKVTELRTKCPCGAWNCSKYQEHKEKVEQYSDQLRSIEQIVYDLIRRSDICQLVRCPREETCSDILSSGHCDKVETIYLMQCKRYLRPDELITLNSVRIALQTPFIQRRLIL